jgi:hypothetical protein
MVQLIPGNDNPTRNDIDVYITRELQFDTENNCHDNNLETIVYRTVREINSKSGVGALLHPAEEYFIEQVESRLSN